MSQQTRTPRSRCSCTITTSRATAQSVTRELVSSVELGASVEPEWTVGPVNHWHQDGPEALGVILKHPRRNKFLKNGHYYVKYLTPLSAKPERSLMDFVTASRCVIRKGPMVFQQLSTACYHEPLKPHW